MPTTATVRSAALSGLEALPVTVSVTWNEGERPGISVSGLSDTQADILLEQVRSAFRNYRYVDPFRCNLDIKVEPESIYKDPYAPALPVAVAYLLATRQISEKWATVNPLIVGEFDSAGYVLPVRGMVAYDRLAAAEGTHLLSARSDVLEHGIPLRSLGELWNTYPLLRRCASSRALSGAMLPLAGSTQPLLLATLCAAVGGHSVLGWGSRDWQGFVTRCYGRLETALRPDMTEGERDELALISSVCGEVDGGTRPYREPDPSITLAGMLGGGKPIIPGEVSLATHGMLHLGNADEFSPAVLDGLIRAREQREVHIVRVDEFQVFPADFHLFGDTYSVKLDSRLRRLFDIRVFVPMDRELGLASLADATLEQLQALVDAALAFRAERQEREGLAIDGYPQVLLDTVTKAECPEDMRERFAEPDERQNCLRIARTLADLTLSEEMTHEHIEMALCLAGYLDRWPELRIVPESRISYEDRDADER